MYHRLGKLFLSLKASWYRTKKWDALASWSIKLELPGDLTKKS